MPGMRPQSRAQCCGGPAWRATSARQKREEVEAFAPERGNHTIQQAEMASGGAPGRVQVWGGGAVRRHGQAVRNAARTKPEKNAALPACPRLLQCVQCRSSRPRSRSTSREDAGS